MNMADQITVVIPNYNGASYIRACLDAMRAQTRKGFRTIVVDNGSADASDRIVEKEYPEATLLRMGSNTGFCGAVNAGIRASGDADYVILLNNDTRADPDFVTCLYEEIRHDPRIFSAQARMLSMKDPSRIDDAGDLYCALGWAFSRGRGKCDTEQFRRKCRIFFSCAGAAIYRKDLLDELGLFDEKHFAYLEDADIGWHARILGYRNVYAPSAVVLHVGSAASGSIYNLFKVKNSSRNSVYLIAKNMPVLQLILNLPLLLPGFLIKWLFFAVKGYGREYAAGIGKGFALSAEGIREGKKVVFRFRNFNNYLLIQWELWVNVLKRLANFFLR